MRNWDTRDETGEDKVARCEWKQDWEDVQSVAQKLGIPCKMVSYQLLFLNPGFYSHSPDRPVPSLLE